MNTTQPTVPSSHQAIGFNQLDHLGVQAYTTSRSLTTRRSARYASGVMRPSRDGTLEIAGATVLLID